MADIDPQRAIDATQGETPAPEFIAELRRTLDIELAAQSDGTRTVLADVSVIDTVLEPDMEQAMNNNKRLMAIVGAAAAVIILIIGIVAITNDDSGPEGTDIGPAGQPEVTPADSAPTGDPDPEAEPAEDPPPISTEALPPPAPNWDFEITYIEVPAGNSVAADAESAWVASSEGTLSRIDLATNTVAATYDIPVGANGTYFGFGAVWIGNGDGYVSRFDPDSETITATIELGGPAEWIEAGDDSMWASNGSGGQAVRIDPTTNTILASIDVSPFVGAIKQNSDGVWIRDFVGTVTRIDPATNAVVATIETPSGGRSMMASPDAVWAPGSESGSVYRIDPSTNTIVAAVDMSAAVGNAVTMFGIHYIGDTIWVRYIHGCEGDDCSNGTHGEARIDPETNEVVAFQDLRDGWTRSGMSVGPTTAWTFSDNVIARMDFEIP